MELTLRCDLPDELAHELTAAAAECNLPVPAFAAQLVECGLASRRLPAVSSRLSKPRMVGESASPDAGDLVGLEGI